MSQHKKTLKPLSLAIGATFAATMAASTVAAAATGSNPFSMHDLHSGYSQVAEMKCGSSMNMNSDASATKGKSDAGKAKTTNEGKCGDNKAKPKTTTEAKCGGNK